ncbi:hypothetical protein B0J12DRAFT_700336 [Macrophomina phaseolina]|uniref:F-box domain-containing protein n=1 Tax=Macrophomina phaseolina TaxID=35725 RepID=A0ABQ8G902_9PEZI|nr:hypothetical protein B0J12DRAFT_700336 [Macrophomina phaseolina]
MEHLAEELCLQLISHLDRGPPSDAHFFHEPDPSTFTSFRDRPLKQLSLVSQKWRRIVKPLLFQYLRFTLHILDDERNEWTPDSAPELAQIRHFLASLGARRSVSSLVVRALGEIYGPPSCDVRTMSSTFWLAIFQHIEPACIKLLAPPAALTRFTACNGDLDHSWAFDQKYHILELRQSPAAVHAALQAPVSNITGLLASRTWCHVGYNEGSSLPAYNLYEYQHYVSPCLLPHLLERMTWAVSTTTTSLTYVAIFPTSSNIFRLARDITAAPDRCKLTFQLAPEPTSAILHERHRMKRAQPADLWVELDRGYELLAGCVFHTSRHSQCWDVRSRDYRWSALVDTLDDKQHLGRLKDHGWVRTGAEWVLGGR